MSTFTPAETLRAKRPLLLAMETIGWFHMAGKARAEFLRRHGGESLDYEERSWHQNETPPFPWDNLLKWVKQLYGSCIPSNALPGSFAEFTEKHAERNPGLLGLLQAGHGIVSGVEKNLPGKTSEYLNQTVLHMWLTSPWGHPKRNLLADPPEVLSPLRELGTRNVQDVALWQRWRKQTIAEGSFIRRAFLSTLAETRLPNNEVTLWDQSYVAAAMFKSAVAGALLDNGFPWSDSSIKGKARWRLLTVAIGTDHYEARGVKIGDWTGAQASIEEFFRRVAELIEADLAVGSLLYRDSGVAIFSFPGERFDESVPTSWLNGWERCLEEQLEAIACEFDLETPPHVRLSQPTRSLVPMAQEREEAQKVVAIPVHKQWGISLADDRGHVCPVCQVRLNGDPTDKTRACRVCRDRRHHRRKAWLQGGLGYETIWFEEVADRNGRLALLSFSLDLEPWLSGERMDSLRAQAIPEWVRFNPQLRGNTPNPIDPKNPFEDITNYIRGKLSSFDKNDPVLTSLQEGYRYESDWPSFFQKVVEDRAVAHAWDALRADEQANWLSHQLFCKLPSPGRVYRFWRESEEFFGELLREFRQMAARSDNPWRVRRLLLIPQNKNGWQDLMLYDGRWRGQQISLVYEQSLGAFITTSNLARVLQPEESKDAFQGATISLRAEQKVGKKQDMVIKAVNELGQPHPHLGVYAPVIPVEISPLRFRVLVPLEVASECVDLAISSWKERFARVWDRMPFRVVVLAFPRTLPYQAVVEATRNLEDALTDGDEMWQVEEVERRNGVVALCLQRTDGQRTLRVVPTTMPDGREDVFYTYVIVEDRELRFPRDFRHPQDGCIYRHVVDLRAGDDIKVSQARIISHFMDSTAARFADLNVRNLEDWTQMRAIWSLLQRASPSQTALERLRNDLAGLEQEWREFSGGRAAPEDLFRDTVRAILVRHLTVRKAVLDTLIEAAMNRVLHWTLNWHMSVLKEGL